MLTAENRAILEEKLNQVAYTKALRDKYGIAHPDYQEFSSNYFSRALSFTTTLVELRVINGGTLTDEEYFRVIELRNDMYHATLGWLNKATNPGAGAILTTTIQVIKDYFTSITLPTTLPTT